MDYYFKTYNTEEILSSLIEYQLMSLINADDTSVPIAEYLISNLLRYDVRDSTEIFTRIEFLSLIEEGKREFETTTKSYLKETLTHLKSDDSTKSDFLSSLMMRLKNLSFRGDAYLFQLVNFANILYSQFDVEFKDKLGFSYSLYEKIIINIYKNYLDSELMLVLKQSNPIWKVKEIWNLFVNKKPFIPQSIVDNFPFRIYKKDLYDKFDHTEIDNILKYSSIQIGNPSIVPITFTGFKPSYEKPFIDFGDYFYLSFPQGTVQNLPKFFHYSFIADKRFGKETIEKYKKVRGELIESSVISYIGNYFDTDAIFQGLKYPSTTKIYESDITIQDNSNSIFCECKSKILTISTLKGDTTSLKNDFEQAIGNAYSQAIKTINWQKSNNDFILEKSGELIKLNDTKDKFVFCIMVENFAIVPFEVQRFLKLDGNPPIIPIIMNIYDFEIVTKECKDKEQFLEYLNFRLNNYELVSTTDELDLLGFFLKRGNVKINIDADKMYIMDYSSIIDKKYNLENYNWLKNYPHIH